MHHFVRLSVTSSPGAGGDLVAMKCPEGFSWSGP